MEELEDDFREAEEGRKLWLDIKEEYGIDEFWYVVIFRERDECLNRIVIDSLPNFLGRKFISKAILIVKNKRCSQECVFKDGIRIYVKQMTEDGIEKILKYYRLVQFEKNIVVVSLAEPYGNDNMIGKEGITLSDYVKDALLV